MAILHSAFVILLTGATGTVGRAVLARLTAADHQVRCLVRDPRKLGSERIRVQLVLGDLAHAGTFRNALRGVHTVIHLAASIRDQPVGSLEEVNGLATARLIRAAELAGCERFVFFSALGASAQSRTRFMRSKALAAMAVERSSMPTSVFWPSIIYAPGDPWLTLLARLSLLPAVPVAGAGHARFQPIWADDVAACVLADLDRPGRQSHRTHVLAGPQVLYLRRDRRCRAGFVRVPPAPAPRAAPNGAHRTPRVGADGRSACVRHMGGGGVDGGADGGRAGLRRRRGARRHPAADGCGARPT